MRFIASVIVSRPSSFSTHWCRPITAANVRLLAFAALIVGVLLIPTALGVAKLDHDRDVSELERALVAETDEHGGALESYFARARAIVLLTANSPAFANVLAEPGTRAQKVRRHEPQPRARSRITSRYLEQLYPTSIGEACFIDAQRRGVRARRARRDRAAAAISPPRRSRPSSSRRPSRCGFGQVHQTAPYVSPDTKEWVVANATLIPQRRRPQARVRALRGDGRELPPRDGRSTAADSDDRAAGRRRPHRPGRHRRRAPQRVGARARRPAATRASPRSPAPRGRAGVTEVDGHRAAYRRIARDAGQRQRLDRRRQRRGADRRASSRAWARVPLGDARARAADHRARGRRRCAPAAASSRRRPTPTR